MGEGQKTKEGNHHGTNEDRDYPLRSTEGQRPHHPGKCASSLPQEKAPGGGDHLSQQRLISLALGGAAFGFIEKSFGAQLPTLPIVGRAGTITLIAYYFSKGRAGGILKDVARAGAVLAGYQIGTTGKISGEDVLAGDIAQQVSGSIAHQV